MFIRRHRSLFGVAYQQTHATLWVYERLLAAHRLFWIVEIGSGTGALSLFWALHGFLRRIPVTSFDRLDVCHHRTRKAYGRLQGRMFQEDVFGETATARIRAIVRARPGLLFCDGGDKVREVKTFAPMAARGSIVVAHDCGFEWKAKELDGLPGLVWHEPWHSQSIAMNTTAAILRRV